MTKTADSRAAWQPAHDLGGLRREALEEATR